VPAALAAKNGAADIGDAELLKKGALTGWGNTDKNGLEGFAHLLNHMKQAEVAKPGQRLAFHLEQLPNPT
jgi:hypothetical protein